MRIFPIIPIWLMIIISLFLILLIILKVKKIKVLIRYIIIIILLFFINLRIMIPNGNLLNLENDLDVLFVIDNTISMNAEDYNGKTRIEGVKQDCKYIIEYLEGARFSLITFNNTSNIVTPYTKDIKITTEAIEIMDTLDELYAKGTNLDIPLEDMLSSLKNSKNKGDRMRIVFFISDGEITSDESLKSFKEVKSYIMDTSDYKYEKAISKIDENNLNKIAKDMKIDYINMNSQNNIYSKLEEIKKMSKSSLTSNDKSSYNDLYYIFVIPLFILLILIFKEYEK